MAWNEMREQLTQSETLVLILQSAQLANKVPQLRD